LVVLNLSKQFSEVVSQRRPRPISFTPIPTRYTYSLTTLSSEITVLVNSSRTKPLAIRTVHFTIFDVLCNVKRALYMGLMSVSTSNQHVKRYTFFMSGMGGFDSLGTRISFYGAKAAGA